MAFALYWFTFRLPQHKAPSLVQQQPKHHDGPNTRATP